MLAALAIGMHVEFRASIHDKIRAEVAEARLEFQGELKEALLIARDARTTAKMVEREHLEETANAK